jgi:TPP-dependent 2-oxoacid decarboxylase
MRGRQVLLDTLINHGVDRIFGNPGTTESPLLDSLLDYPQLQYIVHLHEGVATGAANFYAQPLCAGAASTHPSTGKHCARAPHASTPRRCGGDGADVPRMP